MNYRANDLFLCKKSLLGWNAKTGSIWRLAEVVSGGYKVVYLENIKTKSRYWFCVRHLTTNFSKLEGELIKTLYE